MVDYKVDYKVFVFSDNKKLDDFLYPLNDETFSTEFSKLKDKILQKHLNCNLNFKTSFEFLFPYNKDNMVTYIFHDSKMIRCYISKFIEIDLWCIKNLNYKVFIDSKKIKFASETDMALFKLLFF